MYTLNETNTTVYAYSWDKILVLIFMYLQCWLFSEQKLKRKEESRQWIKESATWNEKDRKKRENARVEEHSGGDKPRQSRPKAKNTVLIPPTAPIPTPQVSTDF